MSDKKSKSDWGFSLPTKIVKGNNAQNGVPDLLAQSIASKKKRSKKKTMENLQLQERTAPRVSRKRLIITDTKKDIERSIPAASLPTRILAGLVDIIIFGIMSKIFISIAAKTGIVANAQELSGLKLLLESQSDVISIGWFLQKWVDFAPVVALVALPLFIHFIYFSFATYSCGQTFGKKLLSIQVIPSDPDEDLGLFTTIFRETFIKPICILVFAIGFFSAAGNYKRQTLYDLACGTRVIKDN